MTEPTVFGSQATEQIVKTVREVARRTMNELPHRARWQHQAGTGSHHIWFTVDAVVCDESNALNTYVTATVTHYTGGCGVVPGEDSYGLVEIHQLCDIFTAYFTAADLVGGVGRATYMYGLDEHGACTPQWIVDLICAAPECA